MYLYEKFLYTEVYLTMSNHRYVKGFVPLFRGYDTEVKFISSNKDVRNRFHLIVETHVFVTSKKLRQIIVFISRERKGVQKIWFDKVLMMFHLKVKINGRRPSIDFCSTFNTPHLLLSLTRYWGVFEFCVTLLIIYTIRLKNHNLRL